MRTFIFIVADAGRKREPEWIESLRGPKLVALANAIQSTAISAAIRSEFDALKLAVNDWHGDLIRYRCGLSAATVKRYRGTLAGWNCRDIALVVEHVSFTDLPPAMSQALDKVPTRLTLSEAEVDLTIAGGRQAIHVNPRLRAAFARAGGR